MAQDFQDFDVKLLARQNAQMLSKMQWYRRENQELSRKNVDLNLWVQNLSEVFSDLGGAWKLITNNEEALYNLLKKRSDPNSKSLISKYISHFRTFDQIVDRLGEKLTNSGHSNDATLEAKEKLNSFVKNYELFFREFVDQYFKFNDEYMAWLGEVQNQPNITPDFRKVSSKEIENRLKIKEFQKCMSQLRGQHKNYESENQHKMLDGLIMAQQKQIQELKDLTQKQSRRIHLMTTYDSCKSQNIIDNDMEYECFCGGKQVQYFKKQYQKHLQLLREAGSKEQKKQSNEMENEVKNLMNRDQFHILEQDKKRLEQRLINLNTKYEKIKIQSKLNEDLILHSLPYEKLQRQTQDLMDYTNDLLQKITVHYQLLNEIQKARDEELLELKEKLTKNKQHKIQTEQQTPQLHIQTNLVEFKTTLLDSIKNLSEEYNKINQQITQNSNNLSSSKEFINSLRQQNQDLLKKLQHAQKRANLPLQFRHEKFTELEKRMNEFFKNILQNDNSQEKQGLFKLWKEFVQYVKSRDKKVKDLENSVRKRDKEIQQKDKLLKVLQQSLTETEKIYTQRESQVGKFSDFMNKTETELLKIAEQNITIKSQFEKEKNLLNYKMKTDQESKAKFEEKIKHYENLQEQMKQLQKIMLETAQQYETWVKEQEEKMMETMIKKRQSQQNIRLMELEAQEKQKTLKRLIEDKQKWKREVNKLNQKLESIQNNTLDTRIKMQLSYLKRKLMCCCGNDRERSIVLKTCPHVFCKQCVEGWLASRSRKCPLCAIKFTKNDVHQIVLS